MTDLALEIERLRDGYREILRINDQAAQPQWIVALAGEKLGINEKETEDDD